MTLQGQNTERIIQMWNASLSVYIPDIYAIELSVKHL